MLSVVWFDGAVSADACLVAKQLGLVAISVLSFLVSAYGMGHLACCVKTGQDQLTD